MGPIPQEFASWPSFVTLDRVEMGIDDAGRPRQSDDFWPASAPPGAGAWTPKAWEDYGGRRRQESTDDARVPCLLQAVREAVGSFEARKVGMIDLARWYVATSTFFLGVGCHLVHHWKGLLHPALAVLAYSGQILGLGAGKISYVRQ